ncbi:HesB/IscA family protein [Spirulina major]|uniref:HesB/IscA family protein n=1 Tax=Spirulina major TaxID=270636 RepID=UPI0009338603|nr:iron-sulfur cluster assembly accessory protein [Spirulina major]
MITLTAAAAQEVRRLQMSHNQANSTLRLTVQPGGCADFVYGLELVATPIQGDHYCVSAGIAMTVAGENVAMVSGLCLDYTEDLMGGGFRFDNPQAVRTCSCGHSFAIAPDLGSGI